MKKILHLTLKRKWFDLIASGEKQIEYRKFKPYWETRLISDGLFKKFDEIHFRNGYGPNAPFVRVKYLGCLITHSDLCRPSNGEKLSPGKYFLLILGSVLELRLEGE